MKRVRVVHPRPIGPVARGVEFGRELVVSTVLGQPGHRQGVEFAASGNCFSDGVSAVAALKEFLTRVKVVADDHALENAEEPPECEREQEDVLSDLGIRRRGERDASRAW